MAPRARENTYPRDSRMTAAGSTMGLPQPRRQAMRRDTSIQSLVAIGIGQRDSVFRAGIA